MLQVPGSWIHESMFDRLIQSLARAPLVPKHEIARYVKAYPHIGTRQSKHSARQRRNLSWPLTEQQQKIVQRLADGERMKEIAFEMGISDKAIAESMVRARTRAGVTTNLELVAKAVAANIISVRDPLTTENTPGRLVVRIAGKTFREESLIDEPEPTENLALEIGRRIAQARNEAGLTQHELGRLVRSTGAGRGTSNVRIQQMEGGHAVPTVPQLMDIGAATNVDPRSFLPYVLNGNGHKEVRDPRAFVNHLSKAEQDLLEKLAEGCSYQEVADQRGVTLETVKQQMKFMRQKLGAKNSAHAVALGYRNGALK